MKDRNVAIIGAGQTKHGIRRDVNQAELIEEAAWDAMDKANVSPDELDAVVVGNMQGFGGRNCVENWAGDWLGASGIPVMRISTGGTTGGSVAQGGYYHVASGLYDVVLSVSWEKHSDSKEAGASTGLANVSMADMFHFFNYGVDKKMLVAREAGAGAAAGVSAMQARSYMHRSGCDIEHLDMVVAKDRRNAAKNPYAHLQMPDATADDIADTDIIVYPLRFGHVCPASDGASAVVLAEEETAERKTGTPAWVKGCAAYADEENEFAEGMQGVAISDSAEQLQAKISAQKAYERANIQNPREEIDVAEIYQPFPHQELIYSERLGLFETDSAWESVEEGITEIDGDMPIDPSGGVNATNAIGSSAMQRVVESALQIMGKAGDRQVPGDVENAVAHGWGGKTQYTTITVLSSSKV